jgi:hypothetical protein
VESAGEKIKEEGNFEYGDEKSEIFLENQGNGEPEELFDVQLLNAPSNVTSPKVTAQSGINFKGRYNQKHKK